MALSPLFSVPAESAYSGVTESSDHLFGEFAGYLLKNPGQLKVGGFSSRYQH